MERASTLALQRVSDDCFITSLKKPKLTDSNSYIEGGPTSNLILLYVEQRVLHRLPEKCDGFGRVHLKM